MTSLTKKLTAALLAVTAAVCLAFGLIFVVPQIASADTATEITLEEDYLNIDETGKVFKGLKDKDSTNTLARRLGSSSNFRIVLPDDITEIEGTSSTQLQKTFGGYARRLVAITLPSGLQTIGDYAFNNCSSLKNLNLPDSVTTIGEGAFLDCTSLEKFVVSANGALKTINKSAFSGCTSLAAVTIPVNVDTIGESAFSNCSKLVDINYYATSAKSLAASPFSGIGKAVVKIEGQTGKTITSLPSNLFRQTNIAKVSFSNVNAKATYWGDEIFSGCTSLTEVTFGDNCKIEIGNKAFANCTALVKVTFPAGGDGLTAIGQNAFLNCAKLTDIAIPEGVASIDGSAFSGCKYLLQVIDNSKGIASSSGAFAKSVTGTSEEGVVIVPNAGQTRIKTTNEGFRFFMNKAASEADAGYKYLLGYTGTSAKVTLPVTGSSQYRIYYNAFENNSTLTEVEITSGVIGIRDGAFRNCTALNTVHVPNIGDEVGQGVFSGCVSLKNITMAKGISTISEEMFKGCTSLETIKIPSAVRNIGVSAFEDCEKLGRVEFTKYDTTGTVLAGNGDGFYLLNTIAANAFKNCKNLKEITVYDAKSLHDTTVTDIAVNFRASAFEGCSSLTTVNVPADATFDTNVFKDCNKDLTIVAPNSASYNNYKKVNSNISTYNLTYTIEFELYNVISGSQDTEKLDSEYRYYGISGQRLPVQPGYGISVWYRNKSGSSLSNKVSSLDSLVVSNITVGDKITLYAYYTEKPDIGENFEVPETYVYSGGYNALTDIEVHKWFKSFVGLEDNIGMTADAKYTVEIVEYTNMSGRHFMGKNEMTDAGTYVLQIAINNPSEYGVWEKGVEFIGGVNPAPLSVNEIEWGVVSGDEIRPLERENQTVPLYNYGAKWYLEIQKDDEGKDITPDRSVQVLKSFIHWGGSGNTVKLINSGAKFTVNSYSDNEGTDGGLYQASATVTMDNNYTLPENHELYQDLGITVYKMQVNNRFIIYKTWYIVSTNVNKLLSSGNKDYEIQGWRYTEDANPEAPKLVVGETSKLSFSLTMYKNGVGTEMLLDEPLKFNYNQFPQYINKAMPAAYYALEVTVPSVTVGAEVYEGGTTTLTFEVRKALPVNLINLKDSNNQPYITSVNPINNNYIEADYNNGERVFGVSKTNLPILGLNSELIHPSRQGTIWNNDELYGHFYTGFVIKYSYADIDTGIYFSESEYTYSEPSSIGTTHRMKYQISAPSYDTLDGRYTLAIAAAIDMPSVSITYTNESWDGKIFNSIYFDAVYLNGKKNKIDDGQLEIDSATLMKNLKNLPEEIRDLPVDLTADKYVDAGEHYVVLFIRSNYSKNKTAKWKEGINVVDGGYGDCVVLKFTIDEAVNSTTIKAAVKPWDWGSYNADLNKPVWTTAFPTGQQFKILSKADAEKTNESEKTYYWYEPAEGALGFDKAPAGDYWLIPIATETGNVQEFNTSNAGAYKNSEWFSFKIEKATINWTTAPHINSWKYGEDGAFTGAPKGKLPEAFAGIENDWKTYICLESQYGQANAKKYETVAELKQQNGGYVPAGNWVYVYEIPEGTNYYARNLSVHFTVLTADNYWDITPVIHDFTYGGYTSTLVPDMNYKPHFGTKSNCVFEFRYYNTNDELIVSWQKSLDGLNLLDENDQLPIGKYQYRVTVDASSNYSKLVFNSEFYISESGNNWIDVPNIIGWGEGNYDSEKNAPQAQAAFGNVYFTVKDANDNVVAGLERVSAAYFTADKLSLLKVGNYKLIAEVDASKNGDYKGLSAEVNFSVFENSVGMTGLIAATMCFAAIALGLAVAGVVLLIRRNKKIEEEFRKMIKRELRRR